MSDALKQQAVVKFYTGTENPILKWNKNEWVIEGDREDAELLAEGINKLIALTTPESVISAVRYSSGWVDDYHDGGHSGCKAEPDGELVDYHVLESAVALLKQAEDQVQELTLHVQALKQTIAESA